MKTVGLITEYNPFHNGHKYHMEQAKKQAHAEHVVVVMSGNFLQRGVPAITDKYTRTKMALSQGADLVIELPVVCATGSAEFFAFGGVSILHSLGFVDTICFGCESGNITILNSIAEMLLKEPEAFRTILTAQLKKGCSYPKARALALTSCFPKETQKDIITTLSSPNNILGIEYLKALMKLNSKITPLALPRIANHYHDVFLSSHNISSATSIRAGYWKNENLMDIANQIPPDVFSILKETEKITFPFAKDFISSLLYYKLLSLSSQELASFSDVGNDFSLRIKKYLGQYKDFSSFCQLIKSKQYTLTRVQRALIHVLLDIKDTVDQTVPFPYIRILGLKKEKSFLLNNIHPPVPIITKVADARRQLSAYGMKLLQQDIFSSNIYNHLLYQTYYTQCKDDYTHGIIIL